MAPTVLEAVKQHVCFNHANVTLLKILGLIGVLT